MKIYLAARYSRHPEMQQIARELTAFGHTITSRWIQGNHPLDDRDLEGEAQRHRQEQLGTEDYDDLLAADCCISFTETPRSHNSRGGRHVEFGIALARNLSCVVVGPRENVFHCLPHIQYYEDWDEARGYFLGDTGETLTFAEALRRCEAAGLITEAMRADWIPTTNDRRTTG